MFVLQNVSFRYGPATQAPSHHSAHSPTNWALHNISLSLPRGSFHLLTGPSGAGKTTLFKLLTLALQPTEGTLTFNSEDLTHATRTQRAHMRRKLGVVYQNFRLLPHLTVRQNVELPLTLHGPLSPTQQNEVAEMLEWVGLTTLAEKPAGQLSGGEQQRTALARAVVHKPEVIIADEPTGNVDAAMSRKILHLLTELHKLGTTIIIATHDEKLINSKQIPIIHLENGTLANG